MGFWGSTLYANDLTSDVRDTYVLFLQMGRSNETAYEETLRILEECTDITEKALFWYALSDTQWELGRLMPTVQESALTYLEQEIGLELWEDDPKGHRGWKSTMGLLRERLGRPQPREKKMYAPKDIQYDPGDIGDVFAYRFHSRSAERMGYLGKYILMQKIGVRENGYGLLCPQMLFFDKLFDEIPEHIDLTKLRILPFDTPERFMPSGKNHDFPSLNLSAILDLQKRKNSPDEHMSLLGAFPIVEGIPEEIDHRAEFGWDDIETTLLIYHPMWKLYSYTLSDPGSTVALI